MHRRQPSRFRRDSPEFDCYGPLSCFTNLSSRFFSSNSNFQPDCT